jgi:Bacterial protein of unknown function (DUF937)
MPIFGDHTMAINLISEVMKMASPAIVERIAASFGLNASMVQSVLAAAVPSIFAGVASQASTPSGLANIMDNLSGVKPSLAASFAGPITGGADNPLVTAGTNMLTSVLGQGAFSNIVNSVTKSTGVSAVAGSSLVALAGQMAMSSLASHSAGMDANGLGKLLSSQAGNISAALPAGMPNMGSTARATSTAAQNTANQAAAAGTNWMMYLLPAVAVAAGLWYFVGMKGADKDDKPMASTTEQVKPAVVAPAVPAGVMVGEVDVSKSLTDSVAGLTTTLSGVTDAASATAAVGKIASASQGIAMVSGLAAKFTPEQKTAVGTLLNGSLPSLNAMVAKLEVLPGVGDILKPAIGPVLDQLTALTK